MSLRRSVILAVTVEGLSQAEAARRYEMSESWVSRLLARYRLEGDAAFEPRSRRPHHSPTATPHETVELIVNLRVDLTDQGLDAGPETIVWHLEHHHGITVSISTVRRRLIDAGLVEPEPRKRPRSSYIRFEADLPNECWQSDFTHWRLADGTDTEVLTWLDDHSRYALSLTAHLRVTGPAVVDTFTETAADQGLPASVLTDNAMVFTTRFAGGRGGRNHLETLLVELGITQKHSRPNHPTTCGKVERFQQTLKKWLTAQPPARTLEDLQAQLDAFVDEYNNRRPHRSLGRATPAAAYQARPKAHPAGSDAGTHHRIRHDHVDTNGSISLRHAGRMHHIGIGRPHARTPVILLIADLDIRVIHRTTGELLRHLTLDPTRDYQPQPKRPKAGTAARRGDI
ncbi:MAG: IS481 family transposase [Acidimicrobiales bacterium]|nr:IS481 family transposase [Acidimicrobiales bacterium]